MTVTTIKTRTNNPGEGSTRTPANRMDECSAALTQLRLAHLSAAAVVADLSLDDAESWAWANDLVRELSAEAYRMTAALTGRPAARVAVAAPPVVRLRELAVAQARLVGALTRATLKQEAGHPDEVTTWVSEAALLSARRVTDLCYRLQTSGSPAVLADISGAIRDSANPPPRHSSDRARRRGGATGPRP